MGKVIRQNVLRETLTIALETGEEIEVLYDEIIINQVPNNNQEGSNQ
jgi:hypothetical protein